MTPKYQVLLAVKFTHITGIRGEIRIYIVTAGLEGDFPAVTELSRG